MKIALPAKVDIPASIVTVAVGSDNVIRVPRPATSVRMTVVVDFDEACRLAVLPAYVLDESPGD